MKNNSQQIDQLIKATLSKEAFKLYEDLDEQNIFQSLLGIFQGKNKWIMFGMNIMTLVFFALFIYCFIQFLKTDVTNEMIQWGIGIVVFLIGVSMLKIFSWMQMDKKALIREIKRLELQVASLSGRMSE
jgi:uncharacterized membrane protein (DUF485 family)